MNRYEHKQIGKLMIGMLGGSFVIIAGITVPLLLMGTESSEDFLIAMMSMAFVGVAMLGMISLFYCLTVTIDHTHLRAAFGIGLIRKSFPLAHIVKAEVVRNKWYYGWGIRLSPGGWMFNIAGLDAVQLTINNGRRAHGFRIGTDEPEKLVQAIEEGMGQVVR